MPFSKMNFAKISANRNIFIVFTIINSKKTNIRIGRSLEYIKNNSIIIKDN